MWLKWFPWRFIVRDVARRQGFLDPIKIFTQLQNFAQPSEVAAPTELLRLGAVLHARGLMNSLAIQHNLDWIWPYWVECQYDPQNAAFIPRSFSLTQINLTHRNWTALGIPGINDFPIVDPRGLVTPFYDSWSIDVWIIPEHGEPLIPSQCTGVTQTLSMRENLCVVTESAQDQLKLRSCVQVIGAVPDPLCCLRIAGYAPAKAHLVVSLRPYNPEGVSFINTIALLDDARGWMVNRKHVVRFDSVPAHAAFSYYYRGDVYSNLSSRENATEIFCKVGMATSAVVFPLEPGRTREITVSVPLSRPRELTAERKVWKWPARGTTSSPAPDAAARSRREHAAYPEYQRASQQLWEQSLHGVCAVNIPDAQFKFLYDAAIRTMILHSPKEVYPGPFVYRRFWFRDAAFILYAMLCVGLRARVVRALDCFRSRQNANGYFLSQEGEWDANGEALWITRQFCAMTGTPLPREWMDSMRKGGMWIGKKRLSSRLPFHHAGLMPAGFSAEHLGPNDYYYWDNFWAIAGLRAAAFFSSRDAARFNAAADELLQCVERSLEKTCRRLHRTAIPASPYRRLDAGAIGSLAASYPLRIFAAHDPRIADTVDFLMNHCLLHNGFFHDMTHSGINPYLTLHIAQALLRAGDRRYFDLMTEVARLASSTGQWPEAVHPRTGGGCMGDGQHVWAAAEWVMMLRNCFVREEQDGLIIGSGIPRAWIEARQPMSFGPALTAFGTISIALTPQAGQLRVAWQGQWLAGEPPIDIQVPGYVKTRVVPGSADMVCEAVSAS